MIEKIGSPQDLKSLTPEEMKTLAEELRRMIIERVSINGGHLSSNLGVVELTIALHYVFNSPYDKIIWDVGHQSYPHKLLTGRQKDFPSLRKHGGLSGFPKISESPHDIFGVGHSSTSISAALGIAAARDLIKQQGGPDETGSVIAVIGDGALTSGLALEGLNQAGHLGKNLIVILNDNEMSISENVGAMSNYLTRVLTGAFYNKFKKETKALIGGIPRIGGTVTKLAEKAEGSLKGFFLPGGLFEDLGFNYIGPVDGHDTGLLIETLVSLKDMTEPTLMHIVTQKGKGYKYSEEDPCIYHGTGPFDSDVGLNSTNCPVPSGVEAPVSYSDLFGEALAGLAAADNRIVAITAAMKEGTGLSGFAERFPDRFFDVGIAEPHAATFAAGLATQGLRPVVAIYSTFLQRAYDEILHDVCLQNLPVLFAVDRGGIVGEDGPTHQGLFDLSFLRHIPDLLLMAPKDGNELKAMLQFGLTLTGPAAIRYPRGRAITLAECPPGSLSPGKAEVLREGDDLCILAVGSSVAPSLKAAEMLAQQGIRAAVINARFVKPIDEELILEFARRTGKLLTVEENILAGGFGSAVLECISRSGLSGVSIKMLGIGDQFVEHGTQKFLRNKYGLDEEGICRAATALTSAMPLPLPLPR
ncbi:MAG: 1-deoxy-D-xylulose-5-phosphate synthase [Nitrospirae bacterium]|nr:MAG: 1-deoxy-D-xylulose-5-phosphate synthase [Nitrospirota bacterium]